MVLIPIVVQPRLFAEKSAEAMPQLCNISQENAFHIYSGPSLCKNVSVCAKRARKPTHGGNTQRTHTHKQAPKPLQLPRADIGNGQKRHARNHPLSDFLVIDSDDRSSDNVSPSAIPRCRHHHRARRRV